MSRKNRRRRRGQAPPGESIHAQLLRLESLGERALSVLQRHHPQRGIPRHITHALVAMAAILEAEADGQVCWVLRDGELVMLLEDAVARWIARHML